MALLSKGQRCHRELQVSQILWVWDSPASVRMMGCWECGRGWCSALLTPVLSSGECPGPWSGAAWCPAALAMLCAAGRSCVLPLAGSLLLCWVFFMVPQISNPLFLSVRQLRPSWQVSQEGKVLQDGSILLLQVCVLAPFPPFPLAVSKGLPSFEFHGRLCWGLSSLRNVSLLPTS